MSARRARTLALRGHAYAQTQLRAMELSHQELLRTLASLVSEKDALTQRLQQVNATLAAEAATESAAETTDISTTVAADIAAIRVVATIATVVSEAETNAYVGAIVRVGIGVRVRIRRHSNCRRLMHYRRWAM